MEPPILTDPKRQPTSPKVTTHNVAYPRNTHGNTTQRKDSSGITDSPYLDKEEPWGLCGDDDDDGGDDEAFIYIPSRTGTDLRLPILQVQPGQGSRI